MNVWNKVLMALVTIMCVVFAIFAANKYNLTKEREQALEKLRNDVLAAQNDVEALKYEIYGDPNKTYTTWRDGGLDTQLKHLRALQNGEFFANCKPVEARMDDAIPTVSFTVDQNYQISPFRAKTLVYLFDSGKPVKGAKGTDGDAQTAAPVDAEEDELGDEDQTVAAPYRFLGVYQVGGVTAMQVKLTVIGNPSEAEQQAVTESARNKNAWVAVVDRLPIDSPADIADIVENIPAIADSFADEARNYFVLGSYEPYDVVGGDGALIDDDELTDSHAGLRWGVNYQGLFDMRWFARDCERANIERAKLAVSNLTKVIADQYAMLGEDPTDQDVLDLEDWDLAYAAAKKNQASLKSYKALKEDADQQLATMLDYCDVVKDALAQAQEGVKACEDAIEQLTNENVEKSAAIATLQREAMRRLEAKNARETEEGDKLTINL
ncbi:MAG: hypothetical protein Q4G03_08340 [Planctomycetia bacterium]|nr:hypothetical protein [Planctomycetia bacterium]